MVRFSAAETSVTERGGALLAAGGDGASLIAALSQAGPVCYKGRGFLGPRLRRAEGAMRVLVGGGGGREKALWLAVAASPLCDKVYLSAGNVGVRPRAEWL